MANYIIRNSGRVVIVSRHEGAVKWLAAELAASLTYDGEVVAIPVLRKDVTADDVRGKIVVGNIPLHLAAVAAEVWAIEFEGAPPRGAEYSEEDMRTAGARLSRYVVAAVANDATELPLVMDRTTARQGGLWC